MQRRIFIALVGAIALVSAVGGFRAAWQGPIASEVVQVANATAFGIQDNHTRFYAALWGGTGLLLGFGLLGFGLIGFGLLGFGLIGFGLLDLDRRHQLLQGVFFLFFVGGIGRLLHMDAAVLATADVSRAAAVELLLFPGLAWWLTRLPEARGSSW